MDIKRIGVGVWAYGTCSDRYVDKGYKPYMNFEERIKSISNIKGISGIELTFPGDINRENMQSIKKMLNKSNLEIAAIGVELVCNGEWKTGSFSSPDEARRRKSIELTKEAMNIAKELNIEVVNLWLGQDGFDYVFQVDYVEAWNNLINCIRECADYCREVKLGIEYKATEPRMRCFVNSGGKALALCMTVDRENVGVTLDVGHAFNAGENPAEIAAVLLSQKRLFHIHLNDNYGIADDDMPLGTVHWPQFIELFYWLDKMGYSGWCSLDLYPYRDNPSSACETSITFLKGVNKFIREKIHENEFISFGKGEAVNLLKEFYSRAFDI